MDSASPSSRFSELVLNLPLELRQEIFNYYLEEAVRRAVNKDMRFNDNLYFMFREIYGIYRGTATVLPHTFKLLSLVQSTGNPYLTRYTAALVQNGLSAVESLVAGSQRHDNVRWIRREFDGKRRGPSYQKYCSVLSYNYERKQAWRTKAFRDWREDYKDSRRRFVIGNSSMRLPDGGDLMKEYLWHAEILRQMRTVPSASISRNG